MIMAVNLMRKPGFLEALQQPAACGGNPGGDTHPVRAGTGHGDVSSF